MECLFFAKNRHQRFHVVLLVAIEDWEICELPSVKLGISKLDDLDRTKQKWTREIHVKSEFGESDESLIMRLIHELIELSMSALTSTE